LQQVKEVGHMPAEEQFPALLHPASLDASSAKNELKQKAASQHFRDRSDRCENLKPNSLKKLPQPP
jgi:hypothetical protein